MTQSSNRGYYSRQDPDSFADNQPVDAPRAWTLRNNIRHLLDQCPQSRASFASLTVADTDLTLIAAAPTVLSMADIHPVPFLHTWLDETVPTNLTIVVRLRSGAEAVDADVRLRVIPDYEPGAFGVRRPIGDFAAPALVDHTHAYSLAGGGDTDANVTQHFFFTTTDAQRIRSAITPIGRPIEEDGEFASPLVAPMRLEISVANAVGTDWTIFLDLLHLREFA